MKILINILEKYLIIPVKYVNIPEHILMTLNIWEYSLKISISPENI